ncbi:MAG: outer membrane beta-barrel protein [Myxococcota bacterium]|nr:outer membrane beta-barrel protein [Myxococcota bacterium]
MKGFWAKWGGVLFLVLFPFWFGGVASAAESTEAELRGLKERLHAVEAEVAQREAALTALDSEGREGASALSAFLEKVDISGLVAAGGSWQKESIPATPTTPSSSDKASTFQLYQGWLELNKTPTEESRAGFNIALEMGDTATQAGNSNEPGIFSAYVSYLAPLGKGLQVDVGIMPTVLGAEHENQSENWNITRGLVWDLQPITSTGVTLTYSLTDSLSLMVGSINDPFASDRFASFSQKSLTGQLAFEQETWGFKAGVNYGRTEGRSLQPFDPYLPPFVLPAQHRAGIYDFVLTWDPFENLGFWANFDYLFGEESNGDPIAGTKAIALALFLGATETIGFAFRYEWIGRDNAEQQRFQTFTATISHNLTDSLTGRFEYRYGEEEKYGDKTIGVNGLFFQWLYEF